MWFFIAWHDLGDNHRAWGNNKGRALMRDQRERSARHPHGPWQAKPHKAKRPHQNWETSLSSHGDNTAPRQGRFNHRQPQIKLTITAGWFPLIASTEEHNPGKAVRSRSPGEGRAHLCTRWKSYRSGERKRKREGSKKASGSWLRVLFLSSWQAMEHGVPGLYAQMQGW